METEDPHVALVDDVRDACRRAALCGPQRQPTLPARARHPHLRCVRGLVHERHAVDPRYVDEYPRAEHADRCDRQDDSTARDSARAADGVVARRRGPETNTVAPAGASLTIANANGARTTVVLGDVSRRCARRDRGSPRRDRRPPVRGGGHAQGARVCRTRGCDGEPGEVPESVTRTTAPSLHQAEYLSTRRRFDPDRVSPPRDGCGLYAPRVRARGHAAEGHRDERDDYSHKHPTTRPPRHGATYSGSAA